MSKRQRTVFNNHAEVCHVWAQGTQESGRSGNIFFTNTTELYSYGYHYLMAKLHTRKGRRFALVNSYVYSASTSQHLGHTRDALRDLMPYFTVSDPSDVSKAVADLDKQVLQALDAALKRKFFADSYWEREESEKESILAGIQSKVSKTNELRELLGRAPFKMPAAKYREVVEHLTKLEERYNSPERAIKRAEKRAEKQAERDAWEKRWEEDRKKREADSAKNLALFRAGERFEYFESEFDLLRIRGNRVETSRHATVPLDRAKLMLQALEDGKDLRGMRIGDFTFRGLESTEDNQPVVVIGCHRILLSEAKDVLKAPALSLVQGGAAC